MAAFISRLPATRGLEREARISRKEEQKKSMRIAREARGVYAVF
jgi:hypothetical protein